MAVLNSNLFITKYRDVAVDMLRLSFPTLNQMEIEYAVDLAIKNEVQDHQVIVDNNYKKTKINTTLLQVSNYILSREPILTAYGVMYSKHGSVPNPLYTMVNGFIIGRDKAKKQMFQYPKGSQDYTKYNLIQLLLKLDANA